MKQLKFFMFILLAITIFSCYSIESDCPDCGDNYGDIIWEPTGNLPHLVGSLYWTDWRITMASNGNIWAYSYDISNHPYDINNQLGLYLSTNNGDTWVDKSNTYASTFIDELYVSSVNGYIFASSVNAGLFRSTDNGENWENIIDSTGRFFLVTESGEIYTIRSHENGNDLYYSNNNGNTWIKKSSSTLLPPLALGKDGTLYAGTGTKRGVYHSTDGGVTWLPPANYDSVRIGSLTICDDGSIFVGTSTYGAMILKSTDKGVNWNNVDTGFDFTSCIKIIFNPITKDIFFSALVDVGFTNSYAKVYRTTNSGKDWKLEHHGLQDPYFDLAVNPKTGQMFIGARNGVYRTKNYPK